MYAGKDIIVVLDYHAENIEYRWFDAQSGEERTGRYPTTAAALEAQAQEALRQAGAERGVVWIMESTTGWARVKELLGPRVKFVLSNVLQMPLPPKAHRRKTDKIDTARLLREYLHGALPTSFQPDSWWRQVRRVVDGRQDLVERQTALKNWISSLLHHETWQERANLWTARGLQRLRALELAATDRMLLEVKLEQLRHLAQLQEQIEAQMRQIYDTWPEAQWLDEIRGIGMVTAVSVLAHIGPIARFPTAEDLISYAGLAPGVRESDQTCHRGRIGGGGTDEHLRYLLIEATTWLRQIPRYRPAYERVSKRRGPKVARIVLARMVLRSIYKMLRERVRFHPLATAEGRRRPAAAVPTDVRPVGPARRRSPAPPRAIVRGQRSHTKTR